MKIKMIINRLVENIKKNKMKYLTAKIALVSLFLIVFAFQTINSMELTKPIAKKKIAVSKLKIKLSYLFVSNEIRTNAIIKYSKKYNIPPMLTAAVIFAESSNIPTAISRVKARGLMQLMQPTAILLAKAQGNMKLVKRIKKNPKVLYNQELNISLGTMFLADLRKMNTSWENTLHSYNVGPTAFRRGRRNHRYVKKIMRLFSDWSKLDLNDIHAKYRYFLSNLYNKKVELIVMN